MKHALLARLAVACLLASPAALAQEPPPAATDPAGNLGTVDGARVYALTCQACHMADGRGAQGGASYPSLAENPTLASSHYMAVTVLAGRGNMPAFDRDRITPTFFEPAWLTDEQIANVINYIRTEFGNQYDDPISAEQVRALRP